MEVKFLVFERKSSEYLMKSLPGCIMGLRWLSKMFDIISVVSPQM